MSNPALLQKGSFMVGVDGGSAPDEFLLGEDGQTIVADRTAPMGIRWADDSGTGVTGPASAVTGNLPSFNGTSGKVIQDSGVLASSVVVGPSSATDNALARFDLTTGKLLQNSPVTMEDTTGAITFPSGGGPILTAGAGAAERKGTFTFDGSGTHTKILTTAAVTGCVIVYTVVTLGTVTAAQAILTTIDTGVGFTPVSAANNDSSDVNWAIIA